MVAVVIDTYTDGIDMLNVKHLRGAVLYIIGVAFPYSFFVKDVSLHHLIIIPILSRAAFFDPILNLFTGNPFNYNGYKDNQNRSLIDKIEDWTGLSIFWLRIIYIALYVGYAIYFIINQ